MLSSFLDFCLKIYAKDYFTTFSSTTDKKQSYQSRVEWKSASYTFASICMLHTYHYAIVAASGCMSGKELKKNQELFMIYRVFSTKMFDRDL